jgi:hypothetical protein
VTDGDGTVATITNGGNATFSRNPASDPRVTSGAPATACPANQGLTVTLTGAPTATTAGTPGVAVAAGFPVISDAAFIVDGAGNPFRTAGSADLVVDEEAGPEPN